MDCLFVIFKYDGLYGPFHFFSSHCTAHSLQDLSSLTSAGMLA